MKKLKLQNKFDKQYKFVYLNFNMWNIPPRNAFK